MLPRVLTVSGSGSPDGYTRVERWQLWMCAQAYTDGACIGNPGPGGWGVYIVSDDATTRELSGGEDWTTNNRMELRAAIEALRTLAESPHIDVITDSEYVKRGITSWIIGWRRRGWKTSTGSPVENLDLWLELEKLNSSRVAWHWVRGHAGYEGNERADALARSEARSQARGAARSPRRGAQRAPVRQPGVRYLSLVDGRLERHATWPECEHRVRGAANARYRKARSDDEESAILRSWGIEAGTAAI
jgi:ribonuclease HI